MEYHLSNFEGPLDLLLHLISKAKLEPKDIFVSDITRQYIEYIENSPALELEGASEFLQMAATLIYIKSRSLLPQRRDDADIDEDGLTPEERLIRQLSEYKRYKEIAATFKELEHQAAQYTYKLPEELLETHELGFSNADVNMLTAAFVRLMQKASEQSPGDVVIYRDGYSVHAQMRMITARLSICPKMRFEDFISESPTRGELSVTFLAIMELLHHRRIRLMQEEIFGSIWLLAALREEAING